MCLRARLVVCLCVCACVRERVWECLFVCLCVCERKSLGVCIAELLNLILCEFTIQSKELPHTISTDPAATVIVVRFSRTEIN
jgi:hypothetical protein